MGLLPRLFAVLLCAPLVAAAAEPADRRARDGVLDLRGLDLSREVVELRGDWRLERGQFLDPAGAAPASAAPVRVPGHWNDAAPGGADGHGTYVLEVQCDAARDLALKLPPQRSALRLFVNGREVAHQGSPGAGPALARPEMVNQLVSLGTQACPLRFTAHVSNYNHRQGGMVRPIEFGAEVLVRTRHERAFAAGVALVSGFLVMALLPLLFFVSRPKERPPLWFGLFCLALAAYMALAREGVLQHLLFGEPGWEAYLKAEYLAWYLSTVLFLLLTWSLFPAETRRGPARALVACGAGVAALVVFTPARIYTQALPAFQLLALLTGIYITYSTALAARAGRGGARLLLGALVVFVSAEAVDLLHEADPLRVTILPFASLLFALAPAAVLILRYGRALGIEESKALAQRQRTDMLVRATKAGFMDWDVARRTVVFSERFREMLGYATDAELAAAGGFFDLLHPEERDFLRDDFVRQLREHSRPNAERILEPRDFRMVRADGEAIWVHAESILLTGPDGRTLRNVCSFIDISDRKRHELEISERAKFFNDVFDAVPVSLAMRDTEGRFLYVNRMWERYMGVTRDRILGKRVQDRLPSEEYEPVIALDREALALGPNASTEPRDHVYRGRRYLQIRTVMADSEGGIIGVLVASLDTTERYAVEQALVTEQRRLDLVVRAAQAGIVDWDGRTHATYYSPRFREIRGYSPDTDTSDWPDYFKVMIHPDDRARVTERFRKYILGSGPEGPQEYYEPEEYRLLRADGSYVWVQIMGVCVRDEKGFATRFIAAVTDITGRREQEQALAFERERLALLLRATRAGFMDWDAVSGAMTYSERFKEMLGYPRDADTAGWPTLFDMMHPDDREEQREAFRNMLRRGAAMGEREHGPLEYRIRRADGTYLWVRGEGIARLDDEGRTTRFITSYIDITDLRRINEALQESVRLREEVERIARHDLKTPLNSIVAAARLLREEREPNASEAELLDIVERAGYRVLSMVNLSFDIFRMERGEYRFQPQAVDVARLVERIAADLRIHAVSKGVGLRLPPAGPAVHAWADELLCYSILANLLKNAIEASPDSTAVTVTLEAGGGHVRLAIHNPGEVPAGVRERFFEKYSTSGKSGGLGLGTYSARLLARVQEGDITLRTSAAEGTTLEIRLLALPQGMQTPTRIDERSVAPCAPAAALPPLSVLVVDDDEYNLLVMRRYLPSPPLTVRTEANGRAAVDAVAEQRFDAIFLDLEMPVMDGLEAAARIRAHERATGARPAGIVAFSSHDDEESRRRSLAAGCNVYLRKPAAREAVHRVLLELTGHALPAEASAGVPAEALPAGPADAVQVDADMRDTIPEFLRTRREAIVQMGEALRDGDPARLRKIAHKLSGSFSLYGFRWASAQCHAIESGDGALAGVAQQVAELTHHLDHVEIRYSGGQPVADRQREGGGKA